MIVCQLLREPNGHENHGPHATRQSNVKEIREMVLVAYDRTWTFSLCSLCFFYNVIGMKSSNENQKKESYIVQRNFQKQYRFEDFFWTGSGDGPVADDLYTNNTDTELNVIKASPIETWKTTTVFHTTTILFATVYPNSEGCMDLACKPEISTVQTESVDFSLPTYPGSMVPDIRPTQTQTIYETNTVFFPDDFFNQKEDNPEGLPPPYFPTESNFIPNTGANSTLIPKTELEFSDATTTTVFPAVPLDQRYWLLTVLRSDESSPKLDINSTEAKLALLYKKAFSRRQDNFLGENEFRRQHTILQPIKVQILNVTREGNNVEIIYSVTVGGKPVPAMSAANEMRLMTASEVIAELGYPILTKAEPYMKNVVPLGARVRGRTRDTWLFIGSVVAAVLLLIILAALFALGLSRKRTKRSTAKGMSNKKQVFEEEGTSNLAFEEETESKKKRSSKRTHGEHSKAQEPKIMGESSGATVKFTEGERRGSTTSSGCSGSSEASLVRLRHQQRRREKKWSEKEDKTKPKPKARMRKIESTDTSKSFRRHGYIQSAGSAVSKNTFDEITTEGCDDLDCSPHLAKSPTSYLSMPSVRAFPRGTKIPEPLNKILEPTSIRHLDADSDSQSEHHYSTRDRHLEVEIEQICEVQQRSARKGVTRHASLEGDDPGFIGPVVWNRHCRKITEGVSEEVEDNVNVGRMRKRFNELLDDALSMFGSRNGSPEGSVVVPARQIDTRVHSAVVRPAGLHFDEPAASRPKTTGSKRPQSSMASCPKGAWETPSCSTLGRPASAGFFSKTSPVIDKNLIYVNSELAPNDPAVPLIAAIKQELKKFEDPPQS